MCQEEAESTNLQEKPSAMAEATRTLGSVCRKRETRVFSACSYVPPCDLRPTIEKKNPPPFIFQHARILPLCRYCRNTQSNHRLRSNIVPLVLRVKEKSSLSCSVSTTTGSRESRTSSGFQSSNVMVFLRLINHEHPSHVDLSLPFTTSRGDPMKSTESKTYFSAQMNPCC